MPLFEETDPTVTGTIFANGGQSIITPQTPVRVVSVDRGRWAARPLEWV